MIPRCFVTKPYSPTSLIPLWLSLDKRTTPSHLSLREGSEKTTNGEAFARWRRDPDENGRILDLDWLSRSLFTDWPDRDRSCTKILQIKSIVRATPFRNLETSENTASMDALRNRSFVQPRHAKPASP